jgi:hypothetical protein
MECIYKVSFIPSSVQQIMLSFSQSQSQSNFTTDGQSVSMSWCRAQFGNFDQRYYYYFFFRNWCMDVR